MERNEMEQYYLFTMPGDSCPVWCEMFGPFGHMVAPTPCADVDQARTLLAGIHPDALVDELFYDDEIAEARSMAAAGI